MSRLRVGAYRLKVGVTQMLQKKVKVLFLILYFRKKKEKKVKKYLFVYFILIINI